MELQCNISHESLVTEWYTSFKIWGNCLCSCMRQLLQLLQQKYVLFELLPCLITEWLCIYMGCIVQLIENKICKGLMQMHYDLKEPQANKQHSPSLKLKFMTSYNIHYVIRFLVACQVSVGYTDYQPYIHQSAITVK